MIELRGNFSTKLSLTFSVTSSVHWLNRIIPRILKYQNNSEISNLTIDQSRTMAALNENLPLTFEQYIWVLINQSNIYKANHLRKWNSFEIKIINYIYWKKFQAKVERFQWEHNLI